MSQLQRGQNINYVVQRTQEKCLSSLDADKEQCDNQNVNLIAIDDKSVSTYEYN